MSIEVKAGRLKKAVYGFVQANDLYGNNTPVLYAENGFTQFPTLDGRVRQSFYYSPDSINGFQSERPINPRHLKTAINILFSRTRSKKATIVPDEERGGLEIGTTSSGISVFIPYFDNPLKSELAEQQTDSATFASAVRAASSFAKPESEVDHIDSPDWLKLVQIVTDSNNLWITTTDGYRLSSAKIPGVTISNPTDCMFLNANSFARTVKALFPRKSYNYQLDVDFQCFQITTEEGIVVKLPLVYPEKVKHLLKFVETMSVESITDQPILVNLALFKKAIKAARHPDTTELSLLGEDCNFLLVRHVGDSDYGYVFKGYFPRIGYEISTKIFADTNSTSEIPSVRFDPRFIREFLESIGSNFREASFYLARQNPLIMTLTGKYELTHMIMPKDLS